MIPISNPQRQFNALKKEITQAIHNVLNSGQYIMGEHVKRLEKEVAQMIGTKEAIAVGNGTDALVLTLEALGITKGDEVITSPFTFFATAEAIAQVGATPVFVDINETFNLDPEKIEPAITEKTKAIMPVHLFGQPAEMKTIQQLADVYDLYIVEDACQAFGAFLDNTRVGALGDAACFSFFPTKNLSTFGDGGMITTNDEQLANRLRSLRTHGSQIKYFHDEIGYNSRLDEIHAAVLLEAIQKIDLWNEERRRIAKIYKEKLRDLDFIKLPKEIDGAYHVYHLFTIVTEKRDDLMNYLINQQIQTGIYYPQPLHLQKALNHLNYKNGNFPNAENYANKSLALPIFTYLTETEQTKVIMAIRNFAGDTV